MADDPLNKLEIEGDVLRCTDKNRARVWETSISAIILIAEYTTDEGPLADDYFLRFWSYENGQHFRANVSFYTDGRNEAIQILSERLGARLEFSLCGSTECDSRVIWPPELIGQPYFSFREVQPANWRERVKHNLFGPIHEYFLTDEVREFLKRHDLKSRP